MRQGADLRGASTGPHRAPGRKALFGACERGFGSSLDLRPVERGRMDELIAELQGLIELARDALGEDEKPPTDPAVGNGRGPATPVVGDDEIGEERACSV